uniref:Uncharacterized protein n=1 Tax=Macrostomum lignano TaxID=282301 RepID=A0A1I8JRC5_9PLAT
MVSFISRCSRPFLRQRSTWCTVETFDANGFSYVIHLQRAPNSRCAKVFAKTRFWVSLPLSSSYPLPGKVLAMAGEVREEIHQGHDPKRRRRRDEKVQEYQRAASSGRMGLAASANVAFYSQLKGQINFACHNQGTRECES